MVEVWVFTLEKMYEVEILMGSIPFRKRVFKTTQFSTYFEGYGLYEDTDFTLRVSKTGKLYLNTAKLNHHHDASGRPNQYQYGKNGGAMGGTYGEPKNPNPSFKHQFKWHAITILLTVIGLLMYSHVFQRVSYRSCG
jgi:GT2 family glycosyltransferase